MLGNEIAKYITNVLSVYRVRPCDPNDDARSDEDFSDEEFVLTEAQLAESLKTRVGGRRVDKSKAKDKTATGKATHEANSRSGMNLAAHIWNAGDDTHTKENIMPFLEEDKDQEMPGSCTSIATSRNRRTFNYTANV